MVEKLLVVLLNYFLIIRFLSDSLVDFIAAVGFCLSIHILFSFVNQMVIKLIKQKQ